MKKKVSFEEALQLLAKDNPDVDLITLEEHLKEYISKKED